MGQSCVGFYYVKKESDADGMREKDIYDIWKESGQLDAVIAFIASCANKLVSQREMCEYLKINESTFSRLKKRHPDIQEAINKARLDLKKDLVDALVKKALGFELVEEEQWIEDGGKGEKQKRKIHRTKKQVPPDYKSIVYLLTKRYGKEFSERYEEIMLAEKKLEQAKEEWENGNRQAESCDDED